MSVKTSNISMKQITAADCEAVSCAAIQAHVDFQSSAMKSAANLYLLSRYVSKGDAKQWFEGRRNDFNAQVAEYNDKITQQFRDADDFHNGKLPEDHEVFKKATTEIEKANQEAQQKKFIADRKIEKSDRAKLKYVAAESNSSSHRFMPIVRVTLDFKERRHKTMVSRYCSALDWIASEFDGKPTPAEADIVAYMQRTGGFDFCIESQRIADENDRNANNAAILRDASKSSARRRVAQGSVVASIDCEIGETDSDFGLLLCRVSNGKVDILGDARLSKNDISRSVTEVAGKLGAFDAPDSMCELIYRMSKLANTIPSGQEVVSANGLKRKSSCVLVLRAGQGGSPEFVISPNCVEAGPVVYVTPKDLPISLPTSAAVLQPAKFKELIQLVSIAGLKDHLTMDQETSPTSSEGYSLRSVLRWRVNKEPLKTANKENYSEEFLWVDLQSITNPPLEVDTFRQEFSASIGRDELLLITDRLKPLWATASKKDPRGRCFVVHMDGETMKFVCGDAPEFQVSCATTYKRKASLVFRISDMKRLFEHLADMPGSGLNLEGDTGGLLRVNWDDKYAQYQYCLPTFTSDNRLQSRRVAFMQRDEYAQAAE